MHYNRLITLIFLINAAALGYGFTQSWWTGGGVALQVLADLTLFNLGLAILARQQYVINFLFWLFTRAPTSWPLAIRWTLGKVYHYGGLHKGGALAGTLWFIIFAGSASYQFHQNLPGISAQSLGLIYGLLVLLVLIVVMAQKNIRARYHDAFERTHRFGGWLSLALFWGLTLSFIDDQRGAQSFSDALTGATSFWILCLLTASIILPWLRLRRVPVQVETPSNHVAVATFDHGVTPFAGSSTAISLNPLMEWHHFANAPSPDKDGFRLVISRAGDWTGNFIEQKPSHVWVKGIPQAGVAYIEVLFKRWCTLPPAAALARYCHTFWRRKCRSILSGRPVNRAKLTVTHWWMKSSVCSRMPTSGIPMPTASRTWSNWPIRPVRNTGQKRLSASPMKNSPGRWYTAWKAGAFPPTGLSGIPEQETRYVRLATR
ncbi:hypothetical protein [Aliamphritea spongicola]|nr:hypothetical protein [Aliamphritea spongicola]